MMLGKRPRHPVKRTTSMTEISFDDLTINQHPPPSDHQQTTPSADDHIQMNQRAVMAMVSPRNTNMIHRRNSADFALQHSPSFLTSCSLCNRRLAPGRDIYMYRGDSAFCSLECRQQQMTQDEWREKCSSTPDSSTVAVSSSKGETVAAL